MTVYVLHRYWNTPDNEGNEIMAVYENVDDAIADMKADADATKAYHSVQPNFWDEDMTWEEEREIHLGRNTRSFGDLAVIYCWEIVEKEVQ